MEEDLAKDLEFDLAGEEEEDEELGKIDKLEQGPDNDDLSFVGRFIEDYKPVLGPQADVWQRFSYVPILDEKVSSLLRNVGNNLPWVLHRLNELCSLLQNEVRLLHTYSRTLYRAKFGELEALVPSPKQYVQVIDIIERDGEASAEKLESQAELSKEQVLVLKMSMKTSYRDDLPWPNEKKVEISRARSNMLAILAIESNVRQFIIQKVSHVAPNLCAFIGPEVASHLLSHAGGILELSQIPSCNLASIGKNKHLAHEQHTSLTEVRQEGYIYRSDLVQSQPYEYHKQALRMACAKVALAARVDAGITPGTKAKDTVGSRWRREIEQKILKQREAVSNAVVKPLPVPKDEPKKKRAGRKFRKYKQQFQLSHLRQLQNRMEFGKQEQTILDGYGEEIGLGMVNSSLKSATGVASVTKTNVNNSAKLTKAMKKRIEQANEQARNTWQQ
ncbi:hypothetical protein HG536_0G01670 [Torulaspora globosa]|uniref:Nop domain-containing protein n=1 Tax=Torulaspora globosa TaxID=48254 RepID=A0A7G3ZLC2_9SACH|nr:uncharacterized protein HG536_0G01670 [Torulaspora globosa]QLL34308.1 hypothetical protein HG536_0G01670 [Torulaspora globosa]